MDKVAIIIPTYNSNNYISECLWSALQQDYQNVEVIVVDNESSDDTIARVETVRDEYYRDVDYYAVVSHDIKEYPVKQIKINTAPNLYKYTWDEATRKGLEIMSDDVEYFMFLASDDKLEHDFVSNCMKILSNADGKIKALQSYIKGINGNSRPQSDIKGYNYKNIKEFKKLCLSQCPVNSPTVMWHNSVWHDGLMESRPEDYAGAGDYWMYCNQADRGLMIYPFPKYLGYQYRWHEGQATWGMHKDFQGVDQKVQEYWRNKWTKDKKEFGEQYTE